VQAASSILAPSEGVACLAGVPRCNSWSVLLKVISGHSSVWLERLLWEQEAVGSNPSAPILSYLGAVEVCDKKPRWHEENIHDAVESDGGPIFRAEDGWYFMDEVWAAAFGPLSSHEEARAELIRYMDEL
jgi:hypothetical protein